jgi:hypothetical protein
MLFLVELDHAKSGVLLTPETARAFIEQIIYPTLSRGEKLIAEKKILAGGTAVGRVALRFILEADTLQDVRPDDFRLSIVASGRNASHAASSIFGAQEQCTGSPGATGREHFRGLDQQ